MPAAKKPRKSAKGSGSSQYSAELSPSQLVLGIAILLIFGLACFLFGVLVGKFDPSLNDRVVRVPESEQLASNLSTPTSTPNNSSESPDATAKSDSPTPAPTSKPIEEKTIVVKSEPTKNPTKPTKPATSIPQSADVTTTDLPPNEPSKPSAEAAAPPETPEIEKPTADEKKVEVPAGTPAANAEIVTAKVEKPKVSEPVKPVQPAPSGPIWSVQIAAFKSAANAETEKARLEKTIPYKVETYTPASSVWTKVLVGRYATRAEADAFRKKLIQSYPINDATLFERK